jgi:single-strand DNA-binding protein
MILNRICLAGNMTKPIEVKSSSGGKVYGVFDIAVSERIAKDKEETLFIRVTCFGKTAEYLGENTYKGSNVYVEGRLQRSEYESNGEKKYSFAVIANSVQVIPRAEKKSKNDEW